MRGSLGAWRGVARTIRVIAPCRWAFAGVLCLVACGPVTYFRTVSGTAEAEVAAARTAGAERAAPYEYTTAVLYLAKAHEEAGHADWQAAIRLGRVAVEQAQRARRIALGGARKIDPADAGDNE